MNDTELVLVHDEGGDGQALYVDGVLVYAHHDATDEALERAGVVQRYDAPLFPTGAWSEAPATLADLAAREEDIVRLRERAEALRAQAAELLAQADEIER